MPSGAVECTCACTRQSPTAARASPLETRENRLPFLPSYARGFGESACRRVSLEYLTHKSLGAIVANTHATLGARAWCETAAAR